MAHTGDRLEWRDSRDGSRLLVAAAALFLLAAAGCVLDRHNADVVTDGLSWFAAHRPTAIPFVAAMVIVAVFLIAAARRIESASADAALTRYVIGAVGVLLLGVVATPYSVNSFFNWTHMIIGGVLFGTQFVLSVWWAWRRRERLIRVLALGQLAAGLLALGSLIGIVDVLLYAQIAFQLIFLAELPWLIARPGPRRPVVEA